MGIILPVRDKLSMPPYTLDVGTHASDDHAPEIFPLISSDSNNGTNNLRKNDIEGVPCRVAMRHSRLTTPLRRKSVTALRVTPKKFLPGMARCIFGAAKPRGWLLEHSFTPDQLGYILMSFLITTRISRYRLSSCCHYSHIFLDN